MCQRRPTQKQTTKAFDFTALNKNVALLTGCGSAHLYSQNSGGRGRRIAASSKLAWYIYIKPQASQGYIA